MFQDDLRKLLDTAIGMMDPCTDPDIGMMPTANLHMRVAKAIGLWATEKVVSDQVIEDVIKPALRSCLEFTSIRGGRPGPLGAPPDPDVYEYAAKALRLLSEQVPEYDKTYPPVPYVLQPLPPSSS